MGETSKPAIGSYDARMLEGTARQYWNGNPFRVLSALDIAIEVADHVAARRIDKFLDRAGPWIREFLSAFRRGVVMIRSNVHLLSYSLYAPRTRTRLHLLVFFHIAVGYFLTRQYTHMLQDRSRATWEREWGFLNSLQAGN